MRNNIVLCTSDGKPSHFKLREFEVEWGDYDSLDMGEHLCLVDSSVVDSLEHVRDDLGMIKMAEVEIIITCACRSKACNEQIAERLGWIDEGGLVSRDSKHLPHYGGIAVDFYAKEKQTGTKVKPKVVAEVANRYFDFVKADYEDGHIHADNRDHV
jgi:hypothetical protein